MSIKNAADLVRAQGRYGDSQLMHVKPSELRSLQTIAQANGTTLTVNPQTGLPEAFNLGAILPAVAGTAIGSMVGAPWLGAAVGGLGTYATTGSLEKGLMAGLGAFGGAGVGSALAKVGAEAGMGAAGALGTEAALSTGPINQALSTTIGEGASNLGSGFSQLMSNPAETFSQMGGLAGQGKNLAMMSAPILGGAFASDPSTGAPEPEGDIRQHDWDPVGMRFVKRPVVSAKNFQGMKPSVFGYAEGGQVDEGQQEALRSQIAKFYREYLKREPDQAGLDYWSGLAAAGTPIQDVLQGLKTSEEATGIRQGADIESFYRDYLGRTPDEGADFWRQAAQQGVPMSEIQQGIRASEEASGIRGAAQQRQAARNPMPQQTPESMVNSMYYNLLGRRPEPEGAQYWADAIRSGASPEEVRQAIMLSSEQQQVQAGQGQPQSGIPQLSAQQQGAGSIPYRYQQPVNTPSQGVTDYNQLLANRANYEYTQMPMPDASRPRTPEETQRIRDNQLIGQQMRLQDIQQGGQRAKQAPQAPEDMQSQIDAAVNAALAGRGFSGVVGDVWYGGNQNDGGGGGGAGGSAGAGPGAGGGDSDAGNGPFARGGVVKYAQGGGITDIQNIPTFQAGGEMESDAFIVPADVVSALGNGSSDAGVALLNQYLGQALPIEGEGDGLSDDIPATIDGEQPARVADGEVYIPAQVVAMLGGGDPERGSAKLYAMMDKIREAAHGKTEQQGEVNPEQVMPV
jgi:hypothetical protein